MYVCMCVCVCVCVCMCVCVYVCMYVCVSESKRERLCAITSCCTTSRLRRETERVCESEREGVSVRAREGRVCQRDYFACVCVRERSRDLIRTSISNKYPGSMKTNPHLDHIRHCTTASGTNWLNRWTYRISTINAHRD